MGPRMTAAVPAPLRRLGPVLAVIVVVAAVAGVADRLDAPAVLSIHGGFVDLSAYRHGGGLMLDGLPLYKSRDPETNLRFTYPPFAAVLLVPLTLVPSWLATALWTALSVGALAGVIGIAGRALGRTVSGWQLALLTGGAIALEPVWQNLTFGQVNLLLMLAVLIDLARPDRRWSGVLVGVAAGVKLTPLVFVVLLVLIGRRTAAARALLAFAGTVAIGVAVAPGSAKAYWTHNLLKAGRVGPPENSHNQSVLGTLTRFLDHAPPRLLWLAVAGPLALAVVVLAAAWWRRGDRVLGTSLAAMAMLLASPISWSHHWVWAVPVALVLWERSRWAAVVWTAVFVVRPLAWPPWGERREYQWGLLEHLPGNAYVLAALALSVWVALQLSPPWARRPRRDLRSAQGDVVQLGVPGAAGEVR